MESAAPILVWHDLYAMLGTSSAALIGLIFVATSLHLADVVHNRAFRVRAYHGTLYLLTLLVEAVLILVPQPLPVLGAELSALNLIGLWLPLSTTYSYYYRDKGASYRAGMMISRTLTYSAAYLVGVFGGIALFINVAWGMYLITASYTALLVTVVLSTWSVMLGIGQTERAENDK
jgi:hypothetical protein